MLKRVACIKGELRDEIFELLDMFFHFGQGTIQKFNFIFFSMRNQMRMFLDKVGFLRRMFFKEVLGILEFLLSEMDYPSMGFESMKFCFVLVFGRVHSFVIEPGFSLLNMVQNNLFLLRIKEFQMSAVIKELSRFISK